MGGVVAEAKGIREDVMESRRKSGEEPEESQCGIRMMKMMRVRMMRIKRKIMIGNVLCAKCSMRQKEYQND